MSDTPRTDARTFKILSDLQSGTREVVDVDISQDLERENAKQERLINLLTKRLAWARDNCRVVFYPPDGAYPIEHAPHARKDMWEALCTAADTSP